MRCAVGVADGFEVHQGSALRSVHFQRLRNQAGRNVCR